MLSRSGGGVGMLSEVAAVRGATIAMTSTPPLVQTLWGGNLLSRSVLFIFSVFAQSRPFLEPLLRLWLKNNLTVLISLVYILRIYKILLYLRYVLEWLPQINPYLPPFSSVYVATNPYMDFFQSFIPPVFGVDMGGLVAWLALEFIETFLSSIPGIAEAVL
ncbi:unnamed protein product [Vitrella brassicaformis CCMP3155]|uniref:YggT family protein n=1 Tax=Vitrella brassicaformis (strain CCMP3155) TaxID=1169540 RepID=A0A0G4FPN1_VITBC|nr:unnamed protein product [Vitrella brassicaformis CCMP3155]|eukprot:CEM16384.1 unnamed protein product [Vitrella brassicaformis CCMP3155]